MKKSILSPDKDYTFSDFYDLPYLTEDIVKEFGYEYSHESLDLPKVKIDEQFIEEFKQDVEKRMPHIFLHSEIGKREFMIAPVLIKLLNFVDIKIRSEYYLNVGKNLRGTLDYFIQSDKYFTVIEAKRDNFEKGFTQLAVEMIAVETYEDEEPKVLFGAVTTGNIWQFGKLDFLNKKIIQDINVYGVPNDFGAVFSILVGILK